MSAPRPLVIVGAGGLGREALAVVRAINAAEPTRPPWSVVGFVDDRQSLWGQDVEGVKVLGPVSLAEAERASADGALGPDTAAIVCTGRPGAVSSRVEIAGRLRRKGRPLATLVHPSAFVPEGTRLGAGSLLLAGVAITTPIDIGDHVVAMPYVVMTHDDEIEAFTTFAAGALLGGGVTVLACAYVGSGAVVRERVCIGAGALVGMGAVVTRDVPAGEVWVGNPARSLGPAAAPDVTPAGDPRTALALTARDGRVDA